LESMECCCSLISPKCLSYFTLLLFVKNLSKVSIREDDISLND
jgi:hypothetical protein